MEVEKRSSKYALPLIGHCTDSASNSLRALITLATPQSYQGLKRNVRFLRMPMTGFTYYALKKVNPNSSVKQADITPHVWQNCDATVIVLSPKLGRN